MQRAAHPPGRPIGRRWRAIVRKSGDPPDEQAENPAMAPVDPLLLERRRAAKRRRRQRDRAVLALVAIAPLGLFVADRVYAHEAHRARGPVTHATAATTSSPNPFAHHDLRAFLRTRAGNVTAAVYDVTTGHTYLYRSAVTEQTASIMKVDILATLLWEHEKSGEPLDGADRALAAQMIHISDNDDAQDLYDEEGGASGTGAFDGEIGMHDTAPNVAGYWGLSWTTAADQVDLLRHLLLPSRELQLHYREYAYDLMRNVTPSQRWGVSAGVPSTAAVALKDGWLGDSANGWQVNSIGSVLGDGRHYLIAVLTDRDPTEQYGIDTISEISAATWQDEGSS